MLNNNEHVILYRDVEALGDVRPSLDSHVQIYRAWCDCNFLRRLAEEEEKRDAAFLRRIGLVP
jgi:hypothetical protein